MQNRFPFSRWSALAFATFIFASCALNQEPSPQLGATGTDIINHPERHVGQQVSIIGTVNNVYSRGSFTVGPEGFLQTDLRVLARGPERNVPRLRSGERVRIVGVVRVFTRREFLGGYPTGFYGTGFGFYGFGPAYAMGPGFYGLRGPGFYPDYYTTWESQPIIIAHRVERL
ncbi:MAG TPA: hypothetical protein VGF73_07185 [Chthoniobacterales bacterium]